jgi:putative transposase
MQSGFRFRLYPTPEQASSLLRWIGCQRFIYNAKVGEDRYFRAFARKSLQHAGQFAPQDQQYSHFITESTPWLREVPSQVLRNGAVRWKQAYSRYWKKLGGRPTIQKRHGKQGVWLTSELFRFEQIVESETGEITYRLHVGTRKHPVGALNYTAHRGHAIPASITLSVDAGRWYVSFTNDDGVPEPSDAETADWLSSFSKEELAEHAVGVDRGVAIPFACSNGARFDLMAVQRERIAKKQAATRRWQRKLSRRTKGGANRRKAAHRIACLRRYEKDARRDFAHQTSHALVADPKVLLIVFEALGVQRMTRKPKAKQIATGRWGKNGARAKAGLNRSILGSAWSTTKAYTEYKARRAGKLVVEVAPHHTSQECAQCGHTHPDNRRSQAGFVCQRCGHTDNADHNAGRNIAHRGVSLILSGEFKPKDRKRVMRMRKKTVGADCSELTLGEIAVSRGTGNGAAPRSTNQETPTSTAAGG